MHKSIYLYLMMVLTITPHLVSAKHFNWPKQYKAAVSLSYDDGLLSHIETVAPSLGRYGFRGTFYPTINSDTMYTHLPQWRQIALNGHELGNHTITHSCSKSKPNREWVKPHHNSDIKTVAQMQEEIEVANNFLFAIDGRENRTFTVPCLEHLVGKKHNYVIELAHLFSAIKGSKTESPSKVHEISLNNTPTIRANGHTAAQLIALAKEAKANGALLSITFHGIGGDHLSVSQQAHQGLLDYLYTHRKDYWVDSFVNISEHIKRVLEGKGK